MNDSRTQATARCQQTFQNRFNSCLALPRCQVQNLQVLLGRPLGLLFGQQVVGQPKSAAGKQVAVVAVVGERARFAHQPVDHMTVLDAMLATPPQPRQTLDQALRVPYLDVIGVDPRLDPFADQPAGHRIDIALHMNRAAAIDLHRHPLAGFQAASRQGTQQRQLLGESGLSAQVPLMEQLTQELRVGGPAGEIPTATQHQRLIQRAFELAVTLLHVAVFVCP